MVHEGLRILPLPGPGFRRACRFLAVPPQGKLLGLSVPWIPHLCEGIHSTRLIGGGRDQEANAQGAFARVSAQEMRAVGWCCSFNSHSSRPSSPPVLGPNRTGGCSPSAVIGPPVAHCAPLCPAGAQPSRSVTLLPLRSLSRVPECLQLPKFVSCSSPKPLQRESSLPILYTGKLRLAEIDLSKATKLSQSRGLKPRALWSSGHSDSPP